MLMTMRSVDYEPTDLAMVDVELFVSGGAPRDALVLVPAEPPRTWPRFWLQSEVLTHAGWRFRGGGWQPPADAEAGVEAVHPYSVGDAWRGGNSWVAEFRLLRGDLTVEAHVDHEWFLDGFETVPSLPSGSPWCWRIVGLPTGYRCGRAENPVLAAAAVEAVLIDVGCRTFERTQTRKSLS